MTSLREMIVKAFGEYPKESNPDVVDSYTIHTDEFYHYLDDSITESILDNYSLSSGGFPGTGSFNPNRWNTTKSDQIDYRTCGYCKYQNRIDYARLPAIAVLKCGNCGGQLE